MTLTQLLFFFFNGDQRGFDPNWAKYGTGLVAQVRSPWTLTAQSRDTFILVATR